MASSSRPCPPASGSGRWSSCLVERRYQHSHSILCGALHLPVTCPQRRHPLSHVHNACCLVWSHLPATFPQRWLMPAGLVLDHEVQVEICSLTPMHHACRVMLCVCQWHVHRDPSWSISCLMHRAAALVERSRQPSSAHCFDNLLLPVPCFQW